MSEKISDAITLISLSLCPHENLSIDVNSFFTTSLSQWLTSSFTVIQLD